MTQTYDLSEVEQPDRPSCDKVYIVVFGLAIAILLGSMGGIMAYMALTYDIREDATSLTAYYHIPTFFISLTLLGFAGLLLIIVFCTLIVLKCDCSKPSTPIMLCTEAGTTSTQVLTISRETVRI